LTIVFVGIGSNLDEPVKQVEEALLELDRLPHTRMVKRSSLYRTAPVGHADQPDFINAVAQLETGLSADRLLSELQEVEASHGRTRSFPNAPRTLDLDLLLFEQFELKTDRLTVPHARMHERAFVLKPLLEVFEQASIPGKGAAKDLLRECREQVVEKIA
jgi:2-amino-4-hydroxy-6-hydroxymethyldihydropteridine diphosphokinase